MVINLKNKSKINKIIFLLLAIILVVIVVIIGLYNKVDDEKFFLDKGFLKYDDESYYKQLSKISKDEFEKNVSNKIASSYSYMYYALGTKHLSEEVGIYSNDVKLEYIGEYNIKNNVITYSMRGTYYSTVVQFTGDYDISKGDFSCSSLVHHDIKYDDELKSDICKISKDFSIDLYNNTVNLIDDKKVLNKIIENTEE